MAIVKTEAYYHSTDGKSMIHTLIWRDDATEPTAVFQIAHGFVEYADRYDRFARFMAQNGFVVCANDHIGHGKSVKSEAELGNFGEPDTDIRMVDDMHVLHNIMSNKYPCLPYYLLGQNLGSFLARIYASNFGHELAGLILSGTSYVGNKLSVLQDYFYPLGDMLGKDKCNTAVSDIFGNITAKLLKEDDTSAWLSVSRENRDESDADPYFDFPITNASAMIIEKALFKSSSEECLANIPQLLPVMLISGAKDIVGLFGKCVTELADKLDSMGINTEVRLYPGLRHEILREDDNENVYKDILNWIQQKQTQWSEFR